jgi:hypothetical protein
VLQVRPGDQQAKASSNFREAERRHGEHLEAGQSFWDQDQRERQNAQEQ